MTSRATVDEFLSHKKLALVRGSSSARVHGLRIDKELGKMGYTISVVHMDKDKLRDLQEPVEGVIIAVTPDKSVEAVQQTIEAKIPRVWLQHGAESKAAIQLCEDKGIPVVSGECVMMFAEPVKSFHAFHRWIWKVLGLLPK